MPITARFRQWIEHFKVAFSLRRRCSSLEARLARAEDHIRGLEGTQRVLMESSSRWRDAANERAILLQEKRKQLLQAELDVARLCDVVEELQTRRPLSPLSKAAIPEGIPKDFNG